MQSMSVTGLSLRKINKQSVFLKKKEKYEI